MGRSHAFPGSICNGGSEGIIRRAKQGGCLTVCANNPWGVSLCARRIRRLCGRMGLFGLDGAPRTGRSHSFAGQLAGLLHPGGELSFVELVVLVDVEVARVLALGLAGRSDVPRKKAKDS